MYMHSHCVKYARIRVFSESWNMSLYDNIRVRENLDSCILHAVAVHTRVSNFARTARANDQKIKQKIPQY